IQWALPSYQRADRDCAEVARRARGPMPPSGGHYGPSVGTPRGPEGRPREPPGRLAEVVPRREFRSLQIRDLQPFHNLSVRPRDVLPAPGLFLDEAEKQATAVGEGLQGQLEFLILHGGDPRLPQRIERGRRWRLVLRLEVCLGERGEEFGDRLAERI